jgi:hypothetical protein
LLTYIVWLKSRRTVELVISYSYTKAVTA